MDANPPIRRTNASGMKDADASLATRGQVDGDAAAKPSVRLATHNAM